MTSKEKHHLVVGAGFVGLATATFLAQRGLSVLAVDTNPDVVAGLRRGRLHFREPELAQRLAAMVRDGRLRAAEPTAEAYAGADWIFIAIDSVDSTDWGMRRRTFESIAAMIGTERRRRSATVVMRSTNVLGFAETFRAMLDATPFGNEVDLVVNPEFLREGHAYEDTASPSRVVVGADDTSARRRAVRLMRSLYGPKVPVIACDWRSAELIKLGANLYLSHRLAFVHEIADYAHREGLDIDRIREAIGLDPRIGTPYFDPGLGFGGSCLPKDCRLIISSEPEVGMEFLTARTALEVNRRVLDTVIGQLKTALGSLRGKKIALLGVAFKPETDDVRNSRAVALARELRRWGASIAAFDPYVKQTEAGLEKSIVLKGAPEDALRNAAAVVLGTAHRRFRLLTPARPAKLVRRKLVLDRFRILNRARWEAEGFRFL